MSKQDTHPTRVLIVENEPELGTVWMRHLERQGCHVHLVHCQETAVAALRSQEFDILVLDVVLNDGSALAVADFASYRQPDAQIIFVSNSAFFSDGSIFAHSANARAMFPSSGRPSDLAAMVEHYRIAG
ncbi:MAG: response regulator transcription factor [Pseudooceanicola sp.]